jgi:hypothetical protein
VEELVALLIQFVVEVGLQLLGGIGVDILASARSRDEKDDPGCGWLILFAVVGAICGGLSLLVAPNLFLPHLGLRIANLIAAPIVAGSLSYLVAHRLWTTRKLKPAHHFWRGFWFALAFGLTRFAYAQG